MIANIASPRMMLVGGGTVRQIAEVLAKFGLSRPLVVTDPFMVSSGLVRNCLEPLEQAGIQAGVFSDTIPEPTDTIVENGVIAIQGGEYDCLIGFGGGSPIDTAKAMALLPDDAVVIEGDMRNSESTLAALRMLSVQLLPL